MQIIATISMTIMQLRYCANPFVKICVCEKSLSACNNSDLKTMMPAVTSFTYYKMTHRG